MKRQEINKIIAQFMGAEIEVRGKGTNQPEYIFHYDNAEFSPIEIMYCNSETALYDKDWDWLIPVYHRLCTLLWNRQKDELNTNDSIMIRTHEFQLQVMRNAPNNASKVVTALILIYERL